MNYQVIILWQIKKKTKKYSPRATFLSSLRTIVDPSKVKKSGFSPFPLHLANTLNFFRPIIVKLV